MSKSNASENAVLQLIFHGVAITGIAQNHGTPSDLYIALHTADPGEAGTMATNEVSTVAAVGYARKQLARNSGNFTISGGVVSLAADVYFNTITGGSQPKINAWSIGPSSGVILYYGLFINDADEPGFDLVNGEQPRIVAGTFIAEM
jgi:hypothetical protein